MLTRTNEIRRCGLWIFVLYVFCFAPLRVMGDFGYGDSDEFCLDLFTESSVGGGCYDYADSVEFELDLLIWPLNGGIGFCESSEFSLDLEAVNRGWGESAMFEFE